MTTLRTAARSARAPLALTAAVLLAAALTACSSSGGAPGKPTPSTPAAQTTATSASSTPDFPASSTASDSTSTTGPSGSSSAGHTSGPPTVPVRTVTTQDPDGGKHVVKIWAEKRDPTCYDHAYGQPVITYLTVHPCQGMDRILATTTTADGRAVGFSLINTSFTGTPKNPYADTAGFRALEAKDGTGSINDLFREGYRLPNGPTHVPSPDAFACLGQDNGVSIYDLWYLYDPTPANDKTLEQLAQDIFLQV